LSRWRVPLLILLVLAVAVWLTLTLVGRSLFVLSPAFVSPLPPDCARGSTALLAQAGLAGWVALRSDGTLVVEVLPPADWPPDHAAQAMWTAFDAVAALPAGCTYRQLEVTVPAGETSLRAVVTAESIRAWAGKDLDDSGFIERVVYFQEAGRPKSP